jgi:hypothetical protein
MGRSFLFSKLLTLLSILGLLTIVNLYSPRALRISSGTIPQEEIVRPSATGMPLQRLAF